RHHQRGAEQFPHLLAVLRLRRKRLRVELVSLPGSLAGPPKGKAALQILRGVFQLGGLSAGHLGGLSRRKIERQHSDGENSRVAAAINIVLSMRRLHCK
ncbi:MAG: hypothetical protein ACREVB_15410, partial [Burkholderiales bacterium]